MSGDLAEVVSPDFPGERLLVCRNPLLAEERARKRSELLAATEQLLDEVVKGDTASTEPVSGPSRDRPAGGTDTEPVQGRQAFQGDNQRREFLLQPESIANRG